jgi:DNA-binding transcriptional regulator GbsR (MarR family)
MTQAEIIAALRAAPDGLTTSEVQERFGISRRDTVSARLSKLYGVGLLQRTVHDGGHLGWKWTYYRWRAKP